jgi:uncharacterized protein with von Willebrand factor type A (vWA) domain
LHKILRQDEAAVDAVRVDLADLVVAADEVPVVAAVRLVVALPSSLFRTKRAST